MKYPVNVQTKLIQEEIENRNKIMDELAKRIRSAREEARLSQLQVGMSIGVSDKTISGYEAARIFPPIDKLLALGDLFKKPISYFLGADPKEYKVGSRLRAVENSLRDIKKQLQEIKSLAQNMDMD